MVNEWGFLNNAFLLFGFQSSFTKSEIEKGLHTEYEKRVLKEFILNQQQGRGFFEGEKGVWVFDGLRCFWEIW